MIASTSKANSSGLPRRDGLGIVLAKKTFTFSGRLDNKGVSNNPATNITNQYWKGWNNKLSASK